MYVDDRAVNPLPTECMLAEIGLVVDKKRLDPFLEAELQYSAIRPREFHRIEMTSTLCLKTGSKKTVRHHL